MIDFAVIDAWIPHSAVLEVLRSSLQRDVPLDVLAQPSIMPIHTFQVDMAELLLHASPVALHNPLASNSATPAPSYKPAKKLACHP